MEEEKLAFTTHPMDVDEKMGMEGNLVDRKTDVASTMLGLPVVTVPSDYNYFEVFKEANNTLRQLYGSF